MAVLTAAAIAVGVIGDRLLRPTAAAISPGDTEPRRYSIVLPDSAPLLVNAPLPFLAVRSLSVSSDGQRLVYLAATPTGRHLRLVRLDGGASSELPHTEDAMLPTFSPNGRHVAFIADGAVQRLSLEDLTVTRLARAPNLPSGLHWDQDGRIYIATSGLTPETPWCLRAVAATGGAEERIGAASCDAQGLGSRLPGTDWLLGHEYRSLIAFPSRTRMPRLIKPAPGQKGDRVGGTNPLALPDGSLVFVRDSTVYGAALDPTSLEFKTVPRALFSGIRRDEGVGQVQWGLTAGGTLVWASGSDLGMARLAFMDRTGSVVDTVFGPPALMRGVSLSADGRRIGVARVVEGGDSRVVILDLKRRVEDPVAASGPLVVLNWLRSGRGLAVGLGPTFPATRTGLVDTTGRLTNEPGDTALMDESPDGARQCGNRGGLSLWRRTEPDRPIRLDEPTILCRFSPDGKWLAWAMDNGLYIAPVDASGPDSRIRISEQGLEFKWGPDSREVLYSGFTEPQTIYSVRIPSRVGERPGEPRLLFKAGFGDAEGPAFDVGPDGRILVILGRAVPRMTRLEVMTNFTTFVARKLGAANP
jgi:hypothetical protein